MHGVRSVSFHSFQCSCPVFPAPLIEETIFSSLYILASFVKDKVCGCVSGFLSCSTSIFLSLYQYHTLLMTVALWYSLKSGRLITTAPFFFLKTSLAIQGLLCFHTNCKIFCSSSVKNAIGNLIGIALNL